MIDSRVEQVELFAWIGEDEHGSGEIGLKQALCPAGVVPMAMTKLNRADQGYIKDGLQQQANRFGKTIYLVRFSFAEVLKELRPQ